MQNEICKNMHTYALQNMHLYASLCINIQKYLNMQIISINMRIPKVEHPWLEHPSYFSNPSLQFQWMKTTRSHFIWILIPLPHLEGITGGDLTLAEVHFFVLEIRGKIDELNMK